ncbi:NERD domain-containing protein [Kitasatospora sp. NBC_01287]|uniref:nuclease-related domain-containing protein n=1 Tax=Kitasatospora sp. NBC_01287 TaxID=2903573 RepID=UPI00224E61D2|nr:nuclease-related domain-containing protein [Kitasatospora sp. NBC_01287]MCX4749348.1 NERD domain-containing protein [Kitasatospora sp. NBC_01287]
MRAEDDLARNLPGAGLESLVRAGEQKFKLPVRLMARLVGDRLGDPATLRGLEGEQIVGAALVALQRVGWKVLHGIPLPSGSDIDHLVIGPPGVFTVNSKHHAGASVWVGGNTVKVNRIGYPYLANSEFEAARTAGLLTEWCGFAVPVHPVIAMVGVRGITRAGTPAVTVIAGEEIASALSTWPAMLSPNQVERAHTVARHAQVWRHVGKGGRAKAR